MKLKDGSKLWSAPPQPQASRDALEKAAKICDAQAKRHNDAIADEQDERECSILKSTAWQFEISAKDIRALIEHDAPSSPIEVQQELTDFAEAVKQLCNDFSSRTGNVYIKDVEGAIDGLLEQHIGSDLIPSTQAKESEG